MAAATVVAAVLVAGLIIWRIGAFGKDGERERGATDVSTPTQGKTSIAQGAELRPMSPPASTNGPSTVDDEPRIRRWRERAVQDIL